MPNDRLHRKAAQGSTAAQIELGSSYLIGTDFEGNSFAQDYRQAEHWLRLAHHQGASTATFLLGTMYEEGKGVDRNIHEAIRLYEIAAAAGAYLPCLRLARLYAASVKNSMAEKGAATWYRKVLDYEGKVEDAGEMEEARNYLIMQYGEP